MIDIERKGNEFQALLTEGKSFQEILGYSQETMELKFQWGKTSYEAKEYEKAKECFSLLTLLNPSMKTYWLALASAQTHMGEDSALISCSMAALLDPTDPLPHFSAAYYHLRKEHKTEAETSLKTCIEIASRHVAYSDLEAQAKALLKKLS